jgi:hypothetical protein
MSDDNREQIIPFTLGATLARARRVEQKFIEQTDENYKRALLDKPQSADERQKIIRDLVDDWRL